jgi:glycosyltransferase involved in cell wall biosynthesis
MIVQSDIKVAMLPFLGQNPYQAELEEALSRYGIESIPANIYYKRPFSILPLFGCDIVHLHWLHPLYQAFSYRHMKFRIKLFIWLLKALKMRGIKLVYTVHNIMPHEQRYPELDLKARNSIVGLIDAFICHDETAKRDFIRKFDVAEEKVNVISHPAFKITKSEIPDRQSARKAYGLSCDIKNYVLFFGRLNVQKGIDRVFNALETFRENGTGVIIAGREFGVELPDLNKFDNVVLIKRFLAEKELPQLFGAVDAVLLPYRSCTTSGVAVTAIAFGKPVVCSDLPFFRIFSESGLGSICNPDNPQEFVKGAFEAINIAKNSSYAIGRQNFIDNNSWEISGEKTAEIYRRLLDNKK